MQTSGLILDVYDDCNGDVIRSLFPTLAGLPDMVKTAHALTGEERDLLPDDVFALVLLNGEERLRKYACTDPGNTALSVLYFLQNGHKLPEEAIKTAAANLAVACEWYDLPVTGLEKVALAGWALRRAVEHPWLALNTAMTAPNVAHEARENNRAVSAIEGAEGVQRPISPEEVREVRQASKMAEISGTALAPASAPGGLSYGVDRGIVKKTGSIGRLVQGGHAKHPQTEKSVPAQTNVDMQHKEQPDALPQAHLRTMRSHVDVTDKHAQVSALPQKVAHYALPEARKYPLDSYAQIKAASAYYDEFGRRFSPSERREFCSNLLKRAEALNIHVGEDVRHYGAEDFGDASQLKVAFDLRARLLEDQNQLDVLTSLFEKQAELGPELFVETLAEFDKLAGLDYLYDKDVPDPYYSCLYKQAQEDFSFVDGNDYITEADLRRLSKVGTKAIKHTFGEDFMVEFQKDPVGIFKSLPKDQKKMIMHMANDNSAPGIALLS